MLILFSLQRNEFSLCSCQAYLQRNEEFVSEHKFRQATFSLALQPGLLQMKRPGYEATLSFTFLAMGLKLASVFFSHDLWTETTASWCYMFEMSPHQKLLLDLLIIHIIFQWIKSPLPFWPQAAKHHLF